MFNTFIAPRHSPPPDGHKQLAPTNLFVVLWSTISLSTVIICITATVCTLVCYYTDTTVELRFDLVGIAVVFPLVFSINSAFGRREQALHHLARMKANANAIRFAHHHWLEGKFQDTSGPKDIDALMGSLFTLTGKYFMSQYFREIYYHKIMDNFSSISWSIEINLRRGGVPPPNLSMVKGALLNLMREFEMLRNIRIYRTPVALRAYTRFFVTLFPVLYSPLFAFIAKDTDSLWGALLMVIMYSLILSGLDAIQDGLEEPFDGEGWDDIHFEEYPKHAVYPIFTPGWSKPSNKSVRKVSKHSPMFFNPTFEDDDMEVEEEEDDEIDDDIEANAMTRLEKGGMSSAGASAGFDAGGAGLSSDGIQLQDNPQHFAVPGLGGAASGYIPVTAASVGNESKTD